MHSSQGLRTRHLPAGCIMAESFCPRSTRTSRQNLCSCARLGGLRWARRSVSAYRSITLSSGSLAGTFAQVNFCVDTRKAGLSQVVHLSSLGVSTCLSLTLFFSGAALTAIQSFMPTAGNGAIAALDYNDDERKRLAGVHILKCVLYVSRVLYIMYVTRMIYISTTTTTNLRKLC